jgi:hypothetical protein
MERSMDKLTIQWRADRQWGGEKAKEGIAVGERWTERRGGGTGWFYFCW